MSIGRDEGNSFFFEEFRKLLFINALATHVVDLDHSGVVVPYHLVDGSLVRLIGGIGGPHSE